MTLIELGQKWLNKNLSNDEVTKEAAKIEIFEPIKADDVTENTIWSNGNGNSWLEFTTELVDSGEMTQRQYNKFLKLVDKGQSIKEWNYLELSYKNKEFPKVEPDWREQTIIDETEIKRIKSNFF